MQAPVASTDDDPVLANYVPVYVMLPVSHDLKFQPFIVMIETEK